MIQQRLYILLTFKNSILLSFHVNLLLFGLPTQLYTEINCEHFIINL